MTYQEERLSGQKRQYSKQAIALAMEGQWQEAVKTNKMIIESYPEDVDAFNRLGRAYIELGDYARANKAYQRAVEIDPYNAIAKKNLQRLSYLNELGGDAKAESRKVEPHQFIEEIGKAGVVNLYQLAPNTRRVKVAAGDMVNLRIDGLSLEVENSKGEYLGRVEPKHGQRLIRLIHGGNEYSVNVIKSEEEAMTVIIREVYQHPSQVGQLSFPSKGMKGFRPYVAEKIFKLDSDFEEEVSADSGYTIIGGEEVEVLPEDPIEVEDELVGDEE